VAAGRAAAAIGYTSGLGETLAPDRVALEQLLLDALQERRTAEIERGVTLVGPHRDDLTLALGDLPAKGYASHGESWSFALALRLAAYDLLRSDGIEPVLVGGPASVGVDAVEPSGLFRISSRTLTAAARRDPRVSWAIAEELNRRLYEVLEQAAVNAFGSVRQRVAVHLLDLASDRQGPQGGLVAYVSQQELADATGSVREVVARSLRDLRDAGIVATGSDHIVILDAARLYAESGGRTGL